jgi:cyclopropane fatty-acyl-phospholipid synthase-like methyltransferase
MEDVLAGGYKTLLVDRLFSDLGEGPARVLDLGCGTAVNFRSALERHPGVAYTGVDQDRAALATARASVGRLPNVELHEGFGEAFRGQDFDLVVSLSVLEHVKHLDPFLKMSVEAARAGGRIVHRYDLGHALTPSSPGERLRVTVAKRYPALVPKSRFTTHPDLDAIVARLTALGVGEIEITQSQMPSLKAAMNRLQRQPDADAAALARRMIELDADVWEQLGTRLDRDDRDRLFPSITVSGYRA